MRKPTKTASYIAKEAGREVLVTAVDYDDGTQEVFRKEIRDDRTKRSEKTGKGISEDGGVNMRLVRS